MTRFFYIYTNKRRYPPVNLKPGLLCFNFCAGQCKLQKINNLATTNRIETIAGSFRSYAPFAKLAKLLRDSDVKTIQVAGLSGSSPAMLINSIYRELGQPIVVVTAGPEEAHDLFDDLSFLLGPQKVGHFPSRQILPYDFRAPIGEIIGQRISTLAGLVNGTIEVVVCPTRALIEPTVTKDNLARNQIHLQVGREYQLDEVVQRLVRLGFRRVPVVEEVGDFALRGGLIDLFTPGFDAPVRVEFFGDEVETIRQFDVATQRTIARVDHVTLLPKREVPITQETVETHLESLPEEDAEYIRTRYLNDPELPGLEWLSILFGLSQGALAIQTRTDDTDTCNLIAAIDDQDNRTTTSAERRILTTMHCGCHAPVGAYAKIDGYNIEITAFISDVYGTNFIRRQTTGQTSDAEQLAENIANHLLTSGGAKIIEELEK